MNTNARIGAARRRAGRVAVVLAMVAVGVLVSTDAARAASPVVTNPGAQFSTAGTAITPLVLTGTDADAGQTLTWSATGLPAGLAIDNSTGRVTGTPTTAGTTAVTVTATDNGSPASSGKVTFNWTVNLPVYRAINLNGAALSAGGIAFEAETGAPNVTAGPNRFCNQGVALNPTTDAATATLVRCSVWGNGTNGASVTMTGVPNGTYQVSLHSWEDNASQTYSLAINGTTVATNVVSGAAGAWRVLGPYTVAVTNGTIAVKTSGGDANLSSLVVSTQPTAGNAAPVVTSPGNQVSTQGTAITPLTVVGSDPDAGQTITWSATGLPAGLSINASTGAVTGTPTAAGSGPVTVTATDNGTPVRSTTVAFTWTVNTPGGTGSIYRAIDLNGPATTAGGIAFEDGTTAPNLVAGPNSFCNQSVTLAPATDAATAALVRCSIWGNGTPGAQITVSSVPNGTYQVSMHTWEDDASQTFGVVINGTTVDSTVVSGPAGTWKMIGPYPVTVTNNALAISSSGGDANFSSLIITTSTSTTNSAPIVTSPGNQTSTQGTAITPLTATGSDPDVGQTLTWSATGLPAGLSINPTSGTITGTPTATGTSSVGLTATDDGSPVRSSTVTFTWTVSPSGTPPPAVYRAVNLNGPATTAGGITYEAQPGAANVTAGPNAFCNQNVPLVPATDAATATLVRCSVWGNAANGATATMSGVPNGTYNVSLHSWEDNASQIFSLAINGSTVSPGIVSGPPGTWQLLGPFPVTVTNGTIAVSTAGGDANLSSLIVAPATASSTTVSVTSPPGGTTTVDPTTISGLAGDAAGVAGVAVQIRDLANNQWWNGSSWQATSANVPTTLASPGATSTAWSYLFDPPTPSSSPYQVTAVATGTGGGVSSPYSTTFSLTVAAGSGFDPSKVTDGFVAGGNWTRSLSADWLPNGHALILTEPGKVYDVDPATGAQSQILDITAKVFSQGESGALDLLVDKAGTGFYVYYTVNGTDRLRISHFDLGSSTEQVVWTNPGLGYNTANPYHVGGSLNLGPDGKLYLTVGDRNEARSQDLTNVFGKVLRINTDGTVPTDNPFYDGAGPNVDEIWAYGLRNPYRTSFDQSTGTYWAGDVGGNVDSQAYEEVNILEKGKNYGWPTCEGPLALPKNGPVCPAGVTGPVYTYAHDSVSAQYMNRAIIGGEVYRGSKFPLGGYYTFVDYPTHTFYWVQLAADGRTAVASGVLASVPTTVPVWMGQGPDGNIYWLSLGPGGDGQLRRLTYAGASDRPPIITTASATPTTGAAPLPVQFTGAATDPDGTPVTYAWDFGDGTTSTQQSPAHTYPANGTYEARLQVTSNGVTVSSDLLSVVVGRPPVVTISSPADGTTFDAGTTLTFTGGATDPDTGPLSGTALSWNIQFLHDDHAHPAENGTGSSISLTIPTAGHDFTGNTRYLVTLTATDPDGVSSSTSITVWPNKVSVKVSSNVATTAVIAGITQNLPFTIDTANGFTESVAVPQTVCVNTQLWSFASWSDGGALAHTVTARAGLELVASYVNTGTACAGWGGMKYSLTSNRASPVLMQGASIAQGTSIYAFLDTTATNLRKVDFWIDQPVTAKPFQTETAAPYDFAGGNNLAKAYSTAGLAKGSHTITVRITRTDGTTDTTFATFTVT